MRIRIRNTANRLKVPMRENFSLGFFILSEPIFSILVGDLVTGKINRLFFSIYTWFRWFLVITAFLVIPKKTNGEYQSKDFQKSIFWFSPQDIFTQMGSIRVKKTRSWISHAWAPLIVRQHKGFLTICLVRSTKAGAEVGGGTGFMKGGRGGASVSS